MRDGGAVAMGLLTGLVVDNLILNAGDRITVDQE